MRRLWSALRSADSKRAPEIALRGVPPTPGHAAGSGFAGRLRRRGERAIATGQGRSRRVRRPGARWSRVGRAARRRGWGRTRCRRRGRTRRGRRGGLRSRSGLRRGSLGGRFLLRGGALGCLLRCLLRALAVRRLLRLLRCALDVFLRFFSLLGLLRFPSFSHHCPPASCRALPHRGGRNAHPKSRLSGPGVAGLFTLFRRALP